MRQTMMYRGIFWIAVYLLLIFAPLFLLLVGPRPEGQGFWTDFSVALGFAGLAMMGFQFLLTARFKRMTAPFGMDIIYHFHRQISVISFALIMAHPLILFVINPETLGLLNIFDTTWQARMGIASIVALISIVVTSLWRERLKLHYETWRTIHSFLAVVAIMTAMAHVAIVANYVEAPWKRALWIALPIFWIGLLVYVRLYKPLVMLNRPYRVKDVSEQRGGAWTLVLQPDGHPGLRHRPGQFAWLTVWNSPFAIREHPFSFSSSAEKDGRLEFAIKELGDFTSTIKEIQPGQRVYLDGPYGQFTVDRHNASELVFLGGGSGIAPLMSTIRTLIDRGDERPMLLFYANKTKDDIIFYEEFEQLQQHPNLRVVHVLEEASDDWDGESGFINAEIIKRHVPEEWHNTHYFICGPDPMMDAVEGALEELDVPLSHYHSERYNFV